MENTRFGDILCDPTKKVWREEREELSTLEKFFRKTHEQQIGFRWNKHDKICRQTSKIVLLRTEIFERNSEEEKI